VEPIDHTILMQAGPEPVFDPVLNAFLCRSRDELFERCRLGGLLKCVSLGARTPWLWRLTFATRGLALGSDGAIESVERHTVGLRFLPDYLRRADRFEMLALSEPRSAFHPNLTPPAICVQINPGETLVEICQSLHALFGWRLRQLNERDALNHAACAWGRAHLDELPIDNRPLFGKPLELTVEPLEQTR
jgi:hypothetical protein